MLNGIPKLQRIILLFIIIAFFSIVFFLLFSRNVHKGLNHDEHQFIASGALLSQKALIPYKDYPYFHMPYLVFVYAAIFKHTNSFLLSARIFSTLCSLFTLGIVFFIAFNTFRRHHYLIRFLIASGSVICLMTNSLFTYTSGRAWNHDLSILLSLLAFVLHCYGARQEKPLNWVLLSGIFLGLAIGVRLTFAPLVVPFLIMIVFYPTNDYATKKTRLFFSFSFGVFMAILPVLLLFMLAPEQFLFGNLGYAKLNTLYRQEIGYTKAMTASGKLTYLFRKVVCKPGNLKIFLPFIFFILSTNILKSRAKASNYFEIIFILILFPFLLLGSFAPTPSFYQYFYAPIPFLMIGALYAIAHFYNQYEKSRLGHKLFANIIIVFMILSSIYGFYYYKNINILLSADKWFPNEAHKIGTEIASLVGEGKVLTLAPIFPLEGKLEIYEEFATGPFAWRTAHILPDDERRELGMISENDLNDFLKTKLPNAILVGFEGDLEEPLLGFAKENKYKAFKLSNGKTLFIR